MTAEKVTITKLRQIISPFFLKNIHTEIINPQQSDLIPYLKDFKRSFTIPTLLTLAAMKAFALGRRAKWKDYVDMFFILRDYYSIKEISNQTQNIFGQLFSEKLFREQLAFHKDVDYTELVRLIVEPVSDDEIKNFMIEKAIDLFD